MLWAAHCVAVAALSTMEIRAKETAQKQQQQQSSSPSAPRPRNDSGTAISISQLKRQLAAHVLDFPLAARSAGIQVAARALLVAALRSCCASAALRLPAR